MSKVKYLKDRLHAQQGMSLIELMLALAISSMLLLLVNNLFFTSSQSLRYYQARSELLGKAETLHSRFSYEFRRVGFWGRVSTSAKHSGQLTIGSDCEGLFSFSRASDADNQQPLSMWASRNKPSGCTTSRMLNQTYVALRYAGELCRHGICTEGPVVHNYDNQINFASSAQDIPVVERSQINNSAPISSWAYQGGIYYLRRAKETNALWRLALVQGKLRNQEIMLGVDEIDYRWGLDRNKDGYVDNWIETNHLNSDDIHSVIGVEFSIKLSTGYGVKNQISEANNESEILGFYSKNNRLHYRYSFIVIIENNRIDVLESDAL